MFHRFSLRSLLVGASVVALVGSVSTTIAFASGIAPSLRDDKQAETGTIVGTVKDKDGNPMASQLVRLMKPAPSGGGGGGGAVIRVVGVPVPDLFQKGGAQGPGKLVAKATSDAQGKFEFKSVEPGTYNLIASKAGVGFGKTQVTVNAKETTTVELKFQ